VKRTFWLSFADEKRPKGSQFLGVCIVDVEADDAEVGVMLAVGKSWLEGCNPGGQSSAVELPQDHPDTARCPRNLLLQTEDLLALRLL